MLSLECAQSMLVQIISLNDDWGVMVVGVKQVSAST